ncbi:MAG TPA: hypothetical protein VJ951_16535, partial [Bacteroidales bacterium]|nr:hypothetical protein [Bacteroidales bacterium]
MRIAQRLLLVTIIFVGFVGCSENITDPGSTSSATGWAYNDPENGGFEVSSAVEQETGPGLVLIE